MAVFCVVATDQGKVGALDDRVRSLIPNGDALWLRSGDWLIAYEGTTRQLSDMLGMSEGETSDGVVLAISAYWGRATKDTWEWLGKKLK